MQRMLELIVVGFGDNEKRRYQAEILSIYEQGLVFGPNFAIFHYFWLSGEILYR